MNRRAKGLKSSSRNENTRKLFLEGYEEMLKRIKPEKILIYGREMEKLEGNIQYIKPFNVNQRMKEEL